ncbi:acyltransferase family protein [Ruminococcus sp. 5_1_39BFAA]|uniref:acyltransferase family protein n=1 Tax=Ruminococcus sp. 5_1_39BFAA TaxID=457412 RepID=UPI003566286C
MNERKIISTTRVFGVCLVVLGHSLTEAVKANNFALDVLSDFIYSFHMFLFFFLAGLLFEKGLKKYINNRKNFIINKAKLLLYPYVFLSLFGYLLGFITQRLGYSLLSPEELEPVNIAKAFLLNVNHFDTHIWYIYFLFIIFAVNILFPKILMKNQALCVLVISGAFYGVLSLTGVRINTFLYYLVPFLMGRRAFGDDGIKKIATMNCWRILLIGATFVVSNCLMLYIDSISGITNPIMGQVKIGLYYEIKILAGITGTIGIIYLAYIISKRTKGLIVNVIDDYSYAIYLLHQPYLTTACMAIASRIVGLNIISVLFTFIVSITVSIAVTKYIIRKVNLLHLVVIGNR